MPLVVGKVLTSTALIVMAIYIWSLSDDFPANGHQLPQFCAIISIIILSVMIVKDIIKKETEHIKFSFGFYENKHYLVFLFSIFYVFSIFIFGYYFSTIMFLVLGSVLVGVRKFKFILVTMIITLPAMYAFFELFLNTGLPRGLII